MANQTINQKNIVIFFTIVALIVIAGVIGVTLTQKQNKQSENNATQYALPTKAMEGEQRNTLDSSGSKVPRTSIVTYIVQKDDTLASLAAKFAISAQTIQWANNMTTENITPGEKLVILPVSGVAHKVAAGDTIDSLAMKYHTTAQKISNFPTNNFANPQTYTLVVGETLIIPDGSL